ncbi:uncharacterized protein PAC_04031 [Phialocephala subalpina]|uniref:Fungal N-terminal domain-containing protein n=1 Tax=Phialocephala subalpina TaxID=576137 RepID=A0A1L7WN24_9HELO|nr:uncharacterized protein PAC_04031 [Phialocephala subalpina]
MDPLSIAASIVGLVTAAKHISGVCGKLIGSRKNGLEEINSVMNVVDTLRSVLLQVRVLVLDQGAIDASRGAMILVDEVITTLSACVLTLSDLDGCVKGMESEQRLGLLDTIRWSSRASELCGFLQKLEAHKSSLSLMLSILTCQSVREAQNAVLDLKVIVSRVLESNELLAERMSALGTSKAPSVMTNVWDDTYSIAQQGASYRMGSPTTQNTLHQDTNPRLSSIVSFEKYLHSSWSWSMFSGLSFSKVSNIAVIALPIDASDLNNGNIYLFDDVDVHNPIIAQPTCHEETPNVLESESSEIRETLIIRPSIHPVTSLEEVQLIQSGRINGMDFTPSAGPSPGSDRFLPIGRVIATKNWTLHEGKPTLCGYKHLHYEQGEPTKVRSRFSSRSLVGLEGNISGHFQASRAQHLGLAQSQQASKRDKGESARDLRDCKKLMHAMSLRGVGHFVAFEPCNAA